MRPELLAVNGRAAATPPALWFRQPASVWEEALPIGNGRLGGMVYGGIAKERVQLNEDTFWTGSPYTPVNTRAISRLPDVRRLIFDGKESEAQQMAEGSMMGVPLKQCSYQPIGELQLNFPSLVEKDVTDYRRSLDLSSAVSSTVFRHQGIAHWRELFASPAHQVIAVSLGADHGGAIDVDIMFSSLQLDSGVEVCLDSQSVILAGRNQGAHGIAAGLDFEARCSVETTGGQVFVGADGLKVRGADRVVLRLAMSTSFVRYNDVGNNPTRGNIKTLQAARVLDYDELKQKSIELHRKIYARLDLDLGETEQIRKPTDQRLREFAEGATDPGLAALYVHFGRYLLITSSRPGSQPSNLQGIWSDSVSPTWDSKWTVNINTEMNYWPAEPANMPEMVQPLIEMVRDLAETGTETARVMYGARGWVCHHNTDLWRATAPIDGPQYGLWPTGGAWLCRHLWDHYDYNREHGYLESVYPIFVGACQFFLDTLVTDPKTGHLVTNPSMSPENRHHENATVCAGPSMDNQIIRDLFRFTAASAEALDTDKELRAELATAAARLRPDSVGASGQLMEWKEDWDTHAPDQDHRHVSHLFGLYPSNQISPDSAPVLASAARQTLLNRGHGGTGWSTAWKISLWARLRDADNAYANVKELLSPELCYSNMFDVHPPLSGYDRAVFQIDGNLGGCAGVLEMLVQDTLEGVRLLPALPKEWRTGHVGGIRLRGGLEARLEWAEGELVELSLRASARKRMTIRYRAEALEVDVAVGQSVRVTGGDFGL